MSFFFFFFFNDTATTEIYTLSLHDALPILGLACTGFGVVLAVVARAFPPEKRSVAVGDRKSTRLNSSHSQISYAVFCLKKKNNRYNIVVTCTECCSYDRMALSTDHDSSIGR